MKKQDATLQTNAPASVVFRAVNARSGGVRSLGGPRFVDRNIGSVPSSPDILSALVDAEILPQLRALHRDGAAIARKPEACSAEQVRLARSLLTDRIGFRDIITGHLAAGSSWPAVASSVLGPAACGLGILWCEDACDFLDVTEAIGWLQATTQALHRLHGRPEGMPHRPRILLAPGPGEVHGYGLSLVAGFFRDAGWTTKTAFFSGGDQIGDLAAALDADGFDVLGLSLACDIHVPGLRAAIPLLRRASRNPDLRVIVGGAAIARGGADVSDLGVDACVGEGHAAPGVASELLHAAVARPGRRRAGTEPQPFR